MYELVKNALSSLNMTLYQYTRLENKAPCIVMNYITSPELYSDNILKGTTYTVMLNVISTSNIQKTNEEILKLMRSCGFRGGRIEGTQPEYNGTTLIGYNTSIRFYIYLEEK